MHVATFFTDVRPKLVLRFAELHGIPKRKLASAYGEMKEATGEANPALENLLGRIGANCLIALWLEEVGVRKNAP